MAPLRRHDDVTQTAREDIMHHVPREVAREHVRKLLADAERFRIAKKVRDAVTSRRRH